jgi:acetamidase/formamidase
MKHHHLPATVETVHWGWFEAALPPVLTIESSDRVTVQSLSGGPLTLPPAGFTVPPELLRIHSESPRKAPGHILTGPIAVRGAMPGDVLEVRILEMRPYADWGYTVVHPLAGALPDDFDHDELIWPAIDVERRTARLPWGTELALKPFFGVIGVAPPPGWGVISSIQPRAHGGNLDNKELQPGATLYLPVHAEGGLLSLGDGHGVQGDGEVCCTAIETALEGTIEVVLRRDLKLDFPRAETPTHLVSMGTDPDLDDAASQALRRMLAWLTDITTLTRHQAFMLMSLAADVRVTQLVNGHKGIHVMLPKALAVPARPGPHVKN